MKEYSALPQGSSITGNSSSDCLVSYQDIRWSGSYSSAEMQSMYSTAPADWATEYVVFQKIYIYI